MSNFTSDVLHVRYMHQMVTNGLSVLEINLLHVLAIIQYENMFKMEEFRIGG